MCREARRTRYTRGMSALLNRRRKAWIAAARGVVGCAVLAGMGGPCATGMACPHGEPAKPETASDGVTLASLLREMVDRDAVCRWPSPSYRSLEASSYNRASTKRDAPGWFADSDGEGFIREEDFAGRHEWVVMEHAGPGCITRLWTPFFYYDFGNHGGPNVRIYLDGSSEPCIDEPLISLVMGKGSIHRPWAAETARAGDLYLPIPFGKSCRVALSAKPFYHIINYRAYEEGTKVETFSRGAMENTRVALGAAGGALENPESFDAPKGSESARWSMVLGPGEREQLSLRAGPGAVAQLVVNVKGADVNPRILRSTVLSMRFDGEQTVWCPVGDFFCSADSIHPFTTWQRSASADGVMTSRWVMPYREKAEVSLVNLGDTRVELAVSAVVKPWAWDERSMHLGCWWRADDVVPGDVFEDWNYVDLRGSGVYVGDAWTVLNPQRGTWWGEGDEKIYVDEAWDRGFPTHFGTGTEDYYGWAGGVVPTRKDEFSHPFLSNVRVGGQDGTTQGYNIVTRSRSLDAIPFTSRLRFDMEASPGVDIRGPKNQLGYSSVVFWYAKEGVTHNLQEDPASVRRRIMHLEGEGDAVHIVVGDGEGTSTPAPGSAPKK